MTQLNKSYVKLLLLSTFAFSTMHVKSQSFFCRLFSRHHHANQTAKDTLTFKDSTSLITFDNASGKPNTDTVRFAKYPPLGNQPTTFTTTQKGNDEVVSKPEDIFNCVSRKVVLSAESTSFMNASYEEQGQHIFPGALYEFNDFLDGSYKEIQAQRNPITISTDNTQLTGASWTEINNPTMATIRDGIVDLTKRFDPKNGATANLRYQIYDYVNNADLSLKISGGIGFGAFSLNNTFKTENKTLHHYLTIDAIKPLYSINVIKPTNGYFSINPMNLKNPVVINSVVYGIRVLANIDVRTTFQSDLDSFVAHFSGVVVTSNIDFEYLKKITDTSTSINCYIVGGPQNSTTAFSINDLKNGITQLLSNVNYSNAKPISYTLSDLQGNVIGVKSATDEITTRECTLKQDTAKLVAASVQFMTGDDDKDEDIDLGIGLYQNTNTKADAVTNSSCSLQQALNGNEFPKPDLLGIASVCYNKYFSSHSTSIPFYFDLTNIVSNGFANGGELLIKHNTNKGDRWDISTVKLNLVFDNGKNIPPITWSFPNSLSLGQGDCLRLQFTSGFSAY